MDGIKSKGFSLIELVVVVAILGICAFLASLSLSTLFSSQASKCSNELDKLLSKTKLNAMSKEAGVYLWLYHTDDGNVVAEYYEKNTLVSTEIIGNSRCSVYYTLNGIQKSLDATGIYFSFQRDTGAFDFSLNTTWPEGAVCSAITVTGGGKTRVITLVPSTGAHTLGG